MERFIVVCPQLCLRGCTTGLDKIVCEILFNCSSSFQPKFPLVLWHPGWETMNYGVISVLDLEWFSVPMVWLTP